MGSKKSLVNGKTEKDRIKRVVFIEEAKGVVNCSTFVIEKARLLAGSIEPKGLGAQTRIIREKYMTSSWGCDRGRPSNGVGFRRISLR